MGGPPVGGREGGRAHREGKQVEMATQWRRRRKWSSERRRQGRENRGIRLGSGVGLGGMKNSHTPSASAQGSVKMRGDRQLSHRAHCRERVQEGTRHVL